MPILLGSVVRVTNLATRKHNVGRTRNAAVPERIAGMSTRKKVFSSKAKRARRAGIRSEPAAAASRGTCVLLAVGSKLGLPLTNVRIVRSLDEGGCEDETFHGEFVIVNAVVTDVRLLVQRENIRTEAPMALRDIGLRRGHRIIVLTPDDVYSKRHCNSPLSAFGCCVLCEVACPNFAE